MLCCQKFRECARARVPVYRTLVITFTKLGGWARSLPSVPLILDQSVGDMRKVKLSALRGCSVSCAPTLTVSKGRASGAANPSRNDLRWAAPLSVRSSVPTRPQLHALHRTSVTPTMT